ncbi:DNA-binding protein [Streptomyces sp. NPDC004609]|uniref:DNA-binding protein n=1 Tax=Streptomyces sp. NPDC004609 TaxID=3364704 RepID=UPI0036A996C4
MWRAHRQLAAREVAARAGVCEELVARLEAGGDWVDRWGVLGGLARALGVDAGALTGQPYPPTGSGHVVIHGFAFAARQLLMRPHVSGGNASRGRLAAAREAEDAGDEEALARALPGVLAGSGTLPSHEGGESPCAGLVMAAGLLRRLGYRDLAWAALERARAVSSPVTADVVAEEVRLLSEWGLGEQALSRAGFHPGSDVEREMAGPVALALAGLGRGDEADRLLTRSNGETLVARAEVALEAGRPERAASLAARAPAGGVGPSGCVRLLVVDALAQARLGNAAGATARLVEAEAVAPLRMRLHPFVRDLVAVLPHRGGPAAHHEALSGIARRAGLI